MPIDDLRYLLLRKESNGSLLGVEPIENTPMLKLANFTSKGNKLQVNIWNFLTCPLPEFFYPFYSLSWMGVIMSVNAAYKRFSPESYVALIDTDDFLNGVMDSRWTIILLVTVPVQLLVHSCPASIYPYFNEWWSASSMKVMHVDGILFLALVMSMAKVVFHLDDLYADIRQFQSLQLVILST